MRPLSVTALRTYLRCPRRYLFRYVQKLPEIRSSYSPTMVLSDVIHRALDRFHAAHGASWEALDEALLASWVPEDFRDSQESARQYHKARWLLWESFSEIASTPIRYGYSFSCDFGGGPFSGRVDRIDQTPHGLELIDYVIGRPLDDWFYHVYAAAVESLFGERVAGIRIIELGRPLKTLNRRISSDEIRREVHGLRTAMAREKLFPAKPESSCSYCGFFQICDDAPGREGSSRSSGGEMFRLFCAISLLVEEEPRSSFLEKTIEQSLRQLDPDGRMIIVDGREISEDLGAVIKAGVEVEGDLIDSDRTLTLKPGACLLAPIEAWAILVFTTGISRNAAEIFARSVRVVRRRALDYIRATTDGLTGLRRREVLEANAEELAREGCSLLFCDIDHFKSINDRLGHDAGDAALRHVARILLGEAGGTSYRLGGEEFAVVYPARDVSFAHARAEFLRRAIESSPFLHGSEQIGLTASFGLATIVSGETFFQVLKRADEALYAAKRAGRNRVVVADE